MVLLGVDTVMAGYRIRPKLGVDGSGSGGSNGGINPVEEPQPVVRPNKRVRYGSPGTLNHPMCKWMSVMKTCPMQRIVTDGTRFVKFIANCYSLRRGKQMQRFCQQIGLQSWNSILDANGLSPYAYASMMNNHSYNSGVASKLADRENGLVSVPVRQ